MREESAGTTITALRKLYAQCWFIQSFAEDGFSSRRHQCANAVMAVYGLSRALSRELYDLTMLEVRPVLYDDIKPKHEITAGRLLGTKCAWMLRYRVLRTEPEFTKFVILIRDLAPYLLFLIDPQNRNRRLDRNPPIGRKNLELILHGCAAAVPLFK